MWVIWRLSIWCLNSSSSKSPDKRANDKTGFKFFRIAAVNPTTAIQTLARTMLFTWAMAVFRPACSAAVRHFGYERVYQNNVYLVFFDLDVILDGPGAMLFFQ